MPGGTVDPPTPDCAKGRYRVTLSRSPAAGSLAVEALTEPVTPPTCLLHADVTASMRYANGHPDGHPVADRRVDPARRFARSRTIILAAKLHIRHVLDVAQQGDEEPRVGARSTAVNRPRRPPRVDQPRRYPHGAKCGTGVRGLGFPERRRDHCALHV
jgi:hypothetical protein